MNVASRPALTGRRYLSGELRRTAPAPPRAAPARIKITAATGTLWPNVMMSSNAGVTAIHMSWTVFGLNDFTRATAAMVMPPVSAPAPSPETTARRGGMTWTCPPRTRDRATRYPDRNAGRARRTVAPA